MLKIEITSTAVELKTGTSNKGKPYSIRSQVAYRHNEGKPYPDPMKINLKDEQPPYLKGFYTLSDDSFYVDGYQNLSISPVLVPFPSQGK